MAKSNQFSLQIITIAVHYMKWYCFAGQLVVWCKKWHGNTAKTTKARDYKRPRRRHRRRRHHVAANSLSFAFLHWKTRWLLLTFSSFVLHCINREMHFKILDFRVHTVASIWCNSLAINEKSFFFCNCKKLSQFIRNLRCYSCLWALLSIDSAAFISFVEFTALTCVTKTLIDYIRIVSKWFRTTKNNRYKCSNTIFLTA